MLNHTGIEKHGIALTYSIEKLIDLLGITFNSSKVNAECFVDAYRDVLIIKFKSYDDEFVIEINNKFLNSKRMVEGTEYHEGKI